ncbi:MAG: autotransporter-associated beta strand repeat-containing protein [Paludibacter sp.]
MKEFLFSIFILTLFFNLSVFSQRKTENLDRGVVSVRNNSGLYFVNWRYLVTDPENVTFNVYARSAATSSFSKLNTTPLSVTNYQSTSGQINNGTQLYVTSLVNGVESTPSAVFTVKTTGFNSYRSAFLDITFNPANDGLELHKYSTKFVWPVDLDGDGEYDYVVDRLSVDGGNHKIQAYLRNGTLLWTVDMGPNVSICEGQDDMVIAYDMDCDGKGDVVIKSSDGTVFANGKGVNGSTSTDTDNDGIIDYGTQNVRNSPQYITVIDGLTGLEKNSIEMKYPSNYTRTNKAIFMGEEYANLNGHMSILYLDGKHPSVGFIYKTRTSADKYHWYYASAYGYNASGQWVNWYNWERGYQNAAEFHSIRAADVDFDGRDELLDGGYGIKYDGSLAFSAGISHGDRFRVSDIDPDRPGLETFAIQQNASDMLGMLLYDSGTGKAIKKFYMSAVGDVGRGECMDIDSTHMGYEFYSTMSNIYNAKGNIIYEGGAPFPNEGVWWDGDLAREELNSPDGNGFNADVRKYDINTHAYGSRLIEFAKMTNWQVKSEWGRRPAFFGDIAGDWREEVVLEKKGSASVTLKDVNGNDSIVTVETCPGFVGFSTDYPTSHRIYCLMQNPAYRMQATTRGYYQSAFPDYYLGFKMSIPPLPPVMSAKHTWKSGTVLNKTNSNFVLQDEITPSVFADGDDILFDISGDNSAPIQMNANLSPSKVYAMNPFAKDYIISGSGAFSGNMELVKSMYGNFILNGNHTFTGKTTIHEGTLTLNGSFTSPVEVRAKGTLAGNAVLNAPLTVLPALNIEGGRLAPGNGLEASKLGKIPLNTNLTLTGKSNLHFDIIPSSVYKNDSILVNGNLTVSGVNNIVVSTISGTLPTGTYSLLKWTGTFTGAVENFNIEGISGLPVVLKIEDNTLKLVVSSVRTVSKVNWTGAESDAWDFVSGNFSLSSAPTYFVTGDSVLVDDAAVSKTIVVNDDLSPANISFVNNSATMVLKGTGGIAGTTNLEKTGSGLLNIETVKNTYTGKTILNNAHVQVASLSDAGVAGSLGMAAVAPANLSMINSKLSVNAVTANTNRGMQITGVDTLNVIKSNAVVTVSGNVVGAGKLVKVGPGQLNLSASTANTYTGGTHIAGGTLALGSLIMNNNGLGTGAITMENGAKLVMYYSTAYGQSPSWNLVIPENKNATLITSGRCDIRGTITGAGTLYFNVPYVRTDLVAGGAAFTGYLNVTTDADGGDFRLTTNTTGFPLAQIYLNNKVYMAAYSAVGSSSANSATAVKLGSLAGVAGSSVGAGTYIIGTDNRDALYAGTLLSGANITKTGSGNWILSGANQINSTFTVSGGKLTVTNTTGSATGTGSVSLSNAILAGTGAISGSVVLNSGARLAPGITSVGTLSFGSSLVLLTGSAVDVDVTTISNDNFTVSGTLSLRGTLKMNALNTTFSAGKSYTIFTAGAVSGNFDAIEPAVPGTGLVWNTSRISEGVISVDVANGVEDVLGANIRIYPTLVQNSCVVELGALTGKSSIELIDKVGKIIMANTSTDNNPFTLDVSPLSQGIYFVRIVNNGNTFLRKIVKL